MSLQNEKKMKTICFLIILVLLIPSFVQTQEWVARYNGPLNSDDQVEAIAVDEKGNVYVTGASAGSDTSWDYTTVKYSSSGIEQWVVRYNNSSKSYDWATAMTLDRKDNVYVTGYSGSSVSSWDYATIKYDSNGVKQWVARYNGPGNDEDCPWAIAVDKENNIYVTGWGTASGYSEYTTIKYDSAGDTIWVARYGQFGFYVFGPNAQTIAIDKKGDIYVKGYSGNMDYAVIKYDSNGVEQWVAKYNGPGNDDDYANAIVLDNEGNVYVTGQSRDSTTSFDYATISYNSDGVEQWIARYDGSANEMDAAIAIAVNEGDVYVTGTSEGSSTNWDYVTIKYAGMGIEENSPSISRSPQLQISPNPFVHSTTVSFSIPTTNNQKLTTICINDITGRVVKTLANEQKPAGNYEVKLSSAGLSTGIYFVTLNTGNHKETKKLILVK